MRKFKFRGVACLTAKQLQQIIEQAYGHYFFTRAQNAGRTASSARARANLENITKARKAKSHLVKGGEEAI